PHHLVLDPVEELGREGLPVIHEDEPEAILGRVLAAPRPGAPSAQINHPDASLEGYPLTGRRPRAIQLRSRSKSLLWPSRATMGTSLPRKRSTRFRYASAHRPRLWRTTGSPRLVATITASSSGMTPTSSLPKTSMMSSMSIIAPRRPLPVRIRVMDTRGFRRARAHSLPVIPAAC